MERRHSNTSDSSTDSNSHIRQLSSDNVETVGLGRVSKVTTPKPAANPLQFVKTGPADLYRSAQEQLKKVEELKKATKQVRDEAEDWQSNLDSWKFSRRKRQEHIIERVVEVKKYELEEHERNRRRSKTFNEMIQDRNIRGRKTSLPVYQDDESNDLSDLGISSGEKSEDTLTTTSDSDQASEKGDAPKALETVPEKENKTAEHNGFKTNGIRQKESTPELNTAEVEEYTYERAIQSYVNFAETRVKSRSTRSIAEDSKPWVNGFAKDSPPAIPAKPRRSSVSTQRIENSINQIEQRKKSISTTDLSSDLIRKQPNLPKVDISKRKELFEKSTTETEEIPRKPSRVSTELPTTRSIRERLSSLKEQTDTAKVQVPNKLAPEFSVKDRLSNIEKLKSNDTNLPKRKSSEQLASQTIRERLSSLEKTKSAPKPQPQPVETTVTIKERLSSLQSACNKETPRMTPPDTESQPLGEKLSNFQDGDLTQGNCYPTNGQGDNYEGVYTPEEVYETNRQRHYRHRSLDSLDVDNDGVSNETFERVQSLEDLDYCRNYPASSLSGDTDREDSGIHTADVSSSVSQADDYDLHLEANSVIDDLRIHHQPTIAEEIKQTQPCDSVIGGQDTLPFDYTESNKKYNVSGTKDFSPMNRDLESEVPDPSFSDNKLSSPTDILLSETLPVILECPSESVSNPLSVVPNYSADQIVPNNVDFSSQDSKSDLCEQDLKHHDVDIFQDDCVFNVHKPSLNPASKETFMPDKESPNSDRMVDGTLQSNQTEKRHSVVEICYKMDSTELKSPPVTHFISVDLPSFISNEKLASSREMPPLEHSKDGNNIYCDLPPTEYIVNNSQFETAVSMSVKKLKDTGSEKQEPFVSNMVDPIDLEPTVIGSETKNSTLEPVYIPNDTIQNLYFSQMGELFVNLNMDQEVESVFQLSPSALEPPKEKPPPPPTDMSDDETENAPQTKSMSLRRLDSTKRIKKEIRQKRSSFLGIEGSNDDSYLDPELELIRPPDMTTLLAEERRMERQLYRQSVCSESDSNQESRDSGVELDNKNHDIAWSHSRNDSETFGNQSTTSEEDEIMRKEREIIETLEQEERIRKQDLGEKLALRLRQLEAEKGREEWERIQQNDSLRNHHSHISGRDHSHTLLQQNSHDTPVNGCREDPSLQDSMNVNSSTSDANTKVNQQESSVRGPIT